MERIETFHTIRIFTFGFRVKKNTDRRKRMKLPLLQKKEMFTSNAGLAYNYYVIS